VGKYKDKKWDASNQKGQHDAQMYAAMVEMADRQIGEVLDLLKELKIDENTIVFVCGDNGGQDYFENGNHPHGFFAPNLNPRTGKRFRGQKGDFHEGGLRIPFIVRWPGKIKPGVVSDHLGYFPDVVQKIRAFAQTASKPLRKGKVLDGSLGFMKRLKKTKYRRDTLFEGVDEHEKARSCGVVLGHDLRRRGAIEPEE